MQWPEETPIEEAVHNHHVLEGLDTLLDRLDADLAARRNDLLADQLPFYRRVLDTPEVEEVTIALLREAVEKGLMELPAPEPVAPSPYALHERTENEAPVRTGWDHFPIYRSDRLCAEHLLIDDCLIATSKAGKVDKKLSAIARVCSSAGEERGRLLNAAVRRLYFHLWYYEALASRQMYRSRRQIYGAQRLLAEVVDWLLARGTTPAVDDLLDILEYRTGAGNDVGEGHSWSDDALMDLVERTAEQCDDTAALRAATNRWRDFIIHLEEMWPFSRGTRDEVLLRLTKLWSDGITIPLVEGEAWSDAALQELRQLPEERQQSWVDLLEHAGTADGGQPKTAWKKTAEELIERVGSEDLVQRSARWFSLSNQPRTVQLPRPSYAIDFDPNLDLNELNTRKLKGLAWCIGILGASSEPGTLRELAMSGLKPVPLRGPRDVKLSNAAIWALSQLAGSEGTAQLAMLKAKVKHKPTLKAIAKAYDQAAQREGVTPEDIEETTIPTYGLSDGGRRTEQLGDFTAELVVTGTHSTELRWLKPDGKPQKSVPKAVKDNFGDELNALKAAAKDIERMLPAQRDRIEQLYLKRKTWSGPTWYERYVDHPLLNLLTQKIIWSFNSGRDGQVVATWLDGQLVDAAGARVDVDMDTASVSLWHPVDAPPDDVQAWRRFFEDHQIKQPFKQAHREVYLLTDAERNTATYSNRFAAHIIKQSQFRTLAQLRGWRCGLIGQWDGVEIPEKVLPEHGLSVDLWIELSAIDEAADNGALLYLVTDQVRFYQCDPRATARDRWGADRDAQPLPLDQIPPLVFSEILRDVDLFVGVASVGNDPTWNDGGPEGQYRNYWNEVSFGDLTATAQTRREILQRLVPRLKIADRCTFDDKFLVVRGERRTYKIHLGSSNILMEPNDQYLCIVPGRGEGGGDKVFLPFEGDQRLAVILSKAMMLAEDTKIADPTILSQIGRK